MNKQGSRAEKIVHPQNDILPKGAFAGHSTYGDNHIGSNGERRGQIKHDGELKIGGHFEGSSSYNKDY